MGFCKKCDPDQKIRDTWHGNPSTCMRELHRLIANLNKKVEKKDKEIMRLKSQIESGRIIRG